jgi:hypothetical protein
MNLTYCHTAAGYRTPANQTSLRTLRSQTTLGDRLLRMQTSRHVASRRAVTVSTAASATKEHRSVPEERAPTYWLTSCTLVHITPARVVRTTPVLAWPSSQLMVLATDTTNPALCRSQNRGLGCSSVRLLWLLCWTCLHGTNVWDLHTVTWLYDRHFRCGEVRVIPEYFTGKWS